VVFPVIRLPLKKQTTLQTRQWQRRRHGGASAADAVKVSQEILAEMVGTIRSRVNDFMNKFRKLRFIEYNGGIRINDALLSVVLHE
jgi:CRP-like cAMP-binding protein